MSRSYLKSKISSNNNIKDIKKYDFHNLNFDLNNKKTILKVIRIPENNILYQGTDFDFNRKKKSYKSLNSDTSINSFKDESNYIHKIDYNEKSLDDFFNYYNQRNQGTYFLSSYKVANIYGLDKDYTTIVYSSIIDINSIKSPKSTIDKIYPLYYIPKKCFTIKYKTLSPLFLLNIGDIDTLKLIWNLLNDNELVKNNGEKLTLDEISNYKYALHTATAYHETINTDIKPPQIPKRVSDNSTDSDLIKLFKYLYIYFYQKSIIINGWIYYNTPNFHDEICLLNHDFIKVEEIYTRKLTKFKDIPTYEKYFNKIKDTIIDYNIKSNNNNILHNYIIPNTLSKNIRN